MKLKNIFVSAFCGVALLSGCMDKFAEINSNPSIIKDGEPRYLFTQQLSDFTLQDYYLWFYDYKDMLQWGQVTVPTGGNGELFNQNLKNAGGPNLSKVMTYMLAIQDEVSKIEKSNPVAAAGYNHLRAMSEVLLVFGAVQNTDMYGSMPYSEAYRARWGGTLTPKYDTQEELFDSFLATLDKSIEILNQKTFDVNGTRVSLVDLSNQDFVYKGDAGRWAKLANSVKLRIAARLYNINKEKSFKIVEEAVANPAGFITESADGFIYNKGTQYYGEGDNIFPGVGSMNTIDFLVKHKDPRVRFFFSKNDYNSLVVQAYFDAKAADKNQSDLPSYIADLVETEVDKDGKKVFKAWKEPGEPWVRYHGLPIEVNAYDDKKYKEYFDPSGKIFKVTLNDKEKSYAATSSLNLDMYRGDLGFTYPDAPDQPVQQDKVNKPYYGLHFAAGETDLYLAEFKLLGANIPGSAADYFTKGITASVKSWDYVAGKNNITYYDIPADSERAKIEASLKLKEGEIEEMLKSDVYQLTGDVASDLEKVYVQQRINFIYTPLELYVTMRRSGVPKKQSTILPLESFKPSGTIEDYPLPRRFSFLDPSPTEKMAPIMLKAWKDQGFSIGTSGKILNTEHVWYDKSSPKFGEGPIIQ